MLRDLQIGHIQNSFDHLSSVDIFGLHTSLAYNAHAFCGPQPVRYNGSTLYLHHSITVVDKYLDVENVEMSEL